MTVSTEAPTAAEMVRANIMAFVNGTFLIGIGIVRAGGGLADDVLLDVLLAFGVPALLLDWYLFGSLRRARKLYEDRFLALIAPMLVAMPFLIAMQEMRPETPIDPIVDGFLMLGAALVAISVLDLRGRKDSDAR